MSEDVTAFLDRCDDVLTDWHGSTDAVHYSRGVPTGPPISFDREFVVFVDGVAVVVDEWPLIMRRIADAVRDVSRHVGMALARCAEHLDDLKPLGIVVDDPAPTDPRERALWLRQHRSTGPQLYRLDGRRR